MECGTSHVLIVEMEVWRVICGVYDFTAANIFVAGEVFKCAGRVFQVVENI